MIVSHEIEMYDYLCHTDPPLFNRVFTKSPDLDYAKAEFVGLVPPSITKDNPYAINEGSTSDYCRFVHVLMSSPYTDGFAYDFALGVEFGMACPMEPTTRLFCI